MSGRNGLRPPSFPALRVGYGRSDNSSPRSPFSFPAYALFSPLTLFLPRVPSSPLGGFAADSLIALHFAFVLFVLFGGLLVLRWRWVAYLHLPAAAWGVLIEFAGWVCPLTPLEQSLRRQAGMAGYEGGFVEHYILPVLYPAGLTRNIQFVLGALVLALNLSVYLYAWKNQRERGRNSVSGEARKRGSG